MRCSDEMVAAVDAARGDVPREVWLRRAIEAYLDPSWAAAERHLVESQARVRVVESNPAPAEQPGRDVCASHPDAGRTMSRGEWWCDAPLCSRKFSGPR